MINVLLVDDHNLVRIGIRYLLNGVKGIKVVADTSSGEEAIKYCRNNQSIDVVLMDIDMPGIGGLEATRKITQYSSHIKVLILTIYTNNPLPLKAMQAGACGYLTKNSTPEEMINAIRTVYIGQRFIAIEIAQQIASTKLGIQQTSPFDNLSERELQIVLMIIKGYKVYKIAEQLSLSPKTINSYRYRVFRKLEITGDVELIRLASDHNLCCTERPITYK